MHVDFSKVFPGSSFQVNFFQTKSPVSQGTTDVNPFWEFTHCLHTQGNDCSLWVPGNPLNPSHAPPVLVLGTLPEDHNAN